MGNLSFRIPDELAAAIARRTRRWTADTGSAVYRRVIEEWVRLQDHPRVRFVDGPAGRRATLVGGPDVWEVIVIGRSFDFDEAAIADAYPWFGPDLLAAARRYQEEFPEEIDAWIRENDRLARDLDRELELLVREGDGPAS